jgi:hypothetical protein
MHLALLYSHIYLTNHAHNLYTVNKFTTNKSKNLSFLLLFQTGENECFYISQALCSKLQKHSNFRATLTLHKAFFPESIY